MTRGPTPDPVAARIAEVMIRIAYLDELDEQHGPSRWRARESEALSWIVDEISEKYPDSVDAACQIAGDRTARRRERSTGAR